LYQTIGRLLEREPAKDQGIPSYKYDQSRWWRYARRDFIFVTTSLRLDVRDRADHFHDQALFERKELRR
jgi:hypothetical protein